MSEINIVAFENAINRIDRKLSRNEIINKEERKILMIDCEPGDATVDPNYIPSTGNRFVDQRNHNAALLSRRSLEGINKSYQNEIETIIRNRNFNKLIELINEIKDIQTNDPVAWGDYLPKHFFQWISERSDNNSGVRSLSQSTALPETHQLRSTDN